MRLYAEKTRTSEEIWLIFGVPNLENHGRKALSSFGRTRYQMGMTAGAYPSRYPEG
jgi:hypothetical protein